MVDPLVYNAQMLVLLRVRQTVLCQHRQAVGSDEFRNAVVDFRVDVVGPSGQNNAAAALFFHLLEDFFALRHNVGLGLSLLRPGQAHRLFDLSGGDVPFLLADLYQPFCGDLFIGKGHKGPDIADFSLGDGFHIVFKVFGIGGDHGAAVVILGIPVFLVFIEYAGVENGGDALVDEPLHMAVGQLGRIALGFRGNGVHAQLVNLPVRERRQHCPNAQLPEEGGPEWIIFIHVQHSGQAQGPSSLLFLGKRGIVKHPLPLVGDHVRGFFPGAGFTGSFFAAVAGNMPPPAGEHIDGKHTVVPAAATASGFGGIGQIHDFF